MPDPGSAQENRNPMSIHSTDTLRYQGLPSFDHAQQPQNQTKRDSVFFNTLCNIADPR